MIASKEVINRAVEFIREKIDPEKIYLFGSYAKDVPTADSDLDFFIIKNTNLPKHQRVFPLYTLDKSKKIGFPIGIDFIVYTPEEFEKGKKKINSIAGEIERTGKILYAR